MEILLRRLRPKGGEIGRDHIPGDNLGAGFLETRDLGCEVIIHDLIAAWINQSIAGLRQCRRQTALRIAPGIAVGVIGKESTDHLVGGLTLPQCQKGGNDVFQTPKEMIGPGEALGRVATAAEEIRLPWTIRGDARHFVNLGLIGHRIGGVRRG